MGALGHPHMPVITSIGRGIDAPLVQLKTTGAHKIPLRSGEGRHDRARLIPQYAQAAQCRRRAFGDRARSACPS
jgi:hypothetical protein